MLPDHARSHLLILLLACGVSVASTQVTVGVADASGILGWEPKSFVGETLYGVDLGVGRAAVRAASDATASALIREIDIDLDRTPVLHWSWRVGNLLGDIDEKTKGGDDYAARIYVLFRGARFDPRPLGMSYVWSSGQPRGTDWPNAYTDRVRMLAVRGPDDPPLAWREERRNIREDIRRYFGREVSTVKAVAIMTDTDNSGRNAVAWYGDIWFAAE